MILGFTGLAGSGKDTAASFLIEKYNFQRISFADKVKELCYEIDPDYQESIDTIGADLTKKVPVFRKLLQDVGHGARQVFGHDFWVDQALGHLPKNKNIAITDVRYQNEFDKVIELGGHVIRITRPGLQMVNNHITETQHLSIPVSFEITNDTKENLYTQLDDIVSILQLELL